MAKRLNPHRRLLKAQALTKARAMAGHDPDGGKLQQGRVRSPLGTMFSIGFHAPKSVPWEGVGTKGKVVRGKLKRVIPGQKPRFS